MSRFVPAALWAAVLSLSACTGSAPPRPAQLHITIDGMHCEDCAIGITKILADAQGVLATDVHFSNRVQTIEYDAARQKPARLITLINDTGFTAKPAPDHTTTATPPAAGS